MSNSYQPIKRIHGHFNVINRSEQGICLTLGKYKGKLMEPGFHYRVPMFQKFYRINLRERVDDIARQILVSRDGVTCHVDACIQWQIVDSAKAFFAVDNVAQSVVEIACLEIRNLLSSLEVNDMLQRRGQVSNMILDNMKPMEERWGVQVSRVELRDIKFDESMTRAMAVKAEADRNAEAKIINAQADVETAKKYKEASEIYVDNPVSLRLREYQLWQSISHSPSSTIYVVPSGIADFLTK